MNKKDRILLGNLILVMIILIFLGAFAFILLNATFSQESHFKITREACWNETEMVKEDINFIINSTAPKQCDILYLQKFPRKIEKKDTVLWDYCDFITILDERHIPYERKVTLFDGSQVEVTEYEVEYTYLVETAHLVEKTYQNCTQEDVQEIEITDWCDIYDTQCAYSKEEIKEKEENGDFFCDECLPIPLPKSDITLDWLEKKCECIEPIKCYTYKPCDCKKYKCGDDEQPYFVETWGQFK